MLTYSLPRSSPKSQPLRVSLLLLRKLNRSDPAKIYSQPESVLALRSNQCADCVPGLIWKKWRLRKPALRSISHALAENCSTAYSEIRLCGYGAMRKVAVLLKGPLPLRTFNVQRPALISVGSLNLIWATSELGTARTSSATTSKI